MEKKGRSNGILITRKTLETLKKLYLTGQRNWECKALQSFLMIDPAGRVAGCHLQEPVATVFDLPEAWRSESFDRCRRVYRECNRCSYMCYMFYSLHANVLGNIEIMRDQWKNAKNILRVKKQA